MLGLGAVMIGVAAFVAGSFVGVGRAAVAQGSGPAEAEKGPGYPGPIYVLTERVVNLADPGVRRYLKVAMAIEFTTGAEEFRKASAEERKHKQAEFDKIMAPHAPVIEDAIITIISARTSNEVLSQEGKLQLKDDIKATLHRLLGEGQVANVYFTQFLMQ